MGIDCRYCHTSVEKAAFAGIPPTKTCMNCHSQIWAQSPYLEPVRESFRTDRSLEWTRVCNDLPDFVYFDHSIHVNKGVGCETCHGRVDEMPLMYQAATLQMRWCLDCHRNPEKYLRPKAGVHDGLAAAGGSDGPRSPLEARVPHPRRVRPDELLDVPQMNDSRGSSPRSPVTRGGSRLPVPTRRRERGVGHATGLPTGLDRRELFQFLGASLALAGATACTRQPAEKIVPYVRLPREIVPGKPLFVRDRDDRRRVPTGLLVESHMGRPTKVEGNPLHPASLGGTDPFGQAAVYSLYDPDRSQTLLSLGEIRPWSAFRARCAAALAEERPRRGAGLRILTETVSSPTLARQLHELVATLPEGRAGTGGSRRRATTFGQARGWPSAPPSTSFLASRRRT